MTEGVDADPSDGAGGRSNVRIGWADVDQPCLEVIEAVTTVTGRDVTDLPPLTRTVDADALDALANGGSDVVVTFTYAGTDVEVAFGHYVEARLLED